MNPDRWQLIEGLFHTALERAPAESRAFLAEACAGDEQMRGEVESLIVAHESAGDFLETPAFEVEAESLADRTTLTAGQTFSHYRILDLVGEGGMGEVYLAEDMRLGRRVALKLLTSYRDQDERRLRRFEQEARAAAALSHPNVCVIHEVDETPDGYHFITMEYVEGKTLRQRMGPARMSLEEALDTAMQVASVLAAAHAAGIVHRDIKPENIMLRPDGCVKVLDFGLAKLTEGQSAFLNPEATTKLPVKTEPGMIMGTVSYMSPEQVRGSIDVDARTDIWSLGVLLYEMVTGRLPFEGATRSHTIVAITDQEPPPLSRFVQGVPEALDDIAKAALAKNTEARYQTVCQMLAALKKLKQHIDAGTDLGAFTPPVPAASAGAIIRVDDGTQTGNGEVPSSTARLGEAEATHTDSIAEYMIAVIKRDKRGVALALAAIVIVVIGSAYFYFAEGGTSGESLAIMPFVNASADPDIEYLSDGIPESLINSLSQLPLLRVTARTTVFRYKGQDADPQELGRNLKVNAVLTGKVLQRGDSLVVQVDLVNTADGTQLWGEQYNPKQLDILAVQKDISSQIANKLRLRLSGEEQRRVIKGYTENVDAYLLYLKGRYFWNQRTEAALKKGIDYFQQAIERDPGYALAYSGLADSYTTLGYLSSLAPKECFPKAKAAATKALELDSMLPEPHTSLAYAKLYYDWDWAGAEREFKQAIALNPNYALSHHWYSVYLTARERHAEARAEIERANELDPLSLIISTDMGFESYYGGQYDQAIKQLHSVLEMQDFPLAHFWLGRAYQQQSKYEQAIAEYQKAEAVLSDWVPAKAAIGNAYARWGKKAEAQRVLDELDELAKEGRYVTPYGTALVYAGLGEKDRAFAALNEAYQQRSHWLVWLKLDRRWGELRNDRRFAELVQRIGLPR